MLIYAIGWHWEHPADFQIIRPDGVHGMQIILVRTKARICMGEQSYEVSPNTAFIVDSCVPHSLFASGEPYTDDWIRFDLETDDMTFLKELGIAFNVPIPLHSDIVSQLIAVGEQIFQANKAERDVTLRHLLSAIMMQIKADYNPTTARYKTHYDSEFELIRQQIYENPCTDWNIAQIAEQLTRMGGAWAALSLLVGKGPGVTLAAVCLTTTLAEAVSCLWLRTAFHRTHIRPRDTRADAAGLIIKESAPVAAGRLVSSALHTAENMLVPSAAAICEGSREAAMGAFGELKGMALPLLLFPSSFLSALSTLLVPEVAGGDSGRIAARSTRLTLEFGFAAAGVFFLFGGELGALIYKSAGAGRYLKALSVIVPFMYLDGICDGLLKGMGLQVRRLVHGCIDSGSRILLIALLLPRYGMDGFLAVMIFSNVLSAVLGYALLARKARIKGALFAFLSPAARCAGSAFLTKFLTPDSAILTKTLLGTALFCLIFALSGAAAGAAEQKIQK